MEAENLPPLMTTKQVSELTGIPEGSLKYFRHRGHGGPRSFALTPRAIRYSRESVLEWISERMQADEQISA
ncbi:putative DNA-binding transcriptional regulator AlpA [Nesterenkonia jeotgali]|uniref:Putative DNA-binding transcriptional regulator AlpA n=2 Tax=Nesterenkonia jeotgali TaxID=317018 RepID=A0A839FEJ7_9MICC|nr:putative DNA-binding transcriptional regulator AlpA [Nesterenkonia jeotgali]